MGTGAARHIEGAFALVQVSQKRSPNKLKHVAVAVVLMLVGVEQTLHVTSQ